MASLPVITGAPTRAPSIDRRKLLAGIALIPAAAIPAAAIAGVVGPDRRAWDRGIAAYKAARDAQQHYERTVYRPMDAALDRLAPRPDLWFEMPDMPGTPFLLPANRLDAYDRHASPRVREKAEVVRAAWHRHLDARRIVNYEAINDEIERLSMAEAEAESVLIKMPAPDLAALWWKLDHLYGEAAGRTKDDEGDGWCAEFVNALMDDAKRLLCGSAH